MVTRITNFAQNAINQFQIQNVQTQIADLQSQVSSGQVSQTFDGIASQAQQLVSLQTEQSKLNQYVSNINLADQRIQTSQNAVSSMLSLATSFQTTLVQALNPSNAPNMALNSSAQQDLNQLASLLNTQFDGDYVFAGSATSTAPVNLSAPGFTPPGPTYPSTPNTAYYQGDSKSPTVQADDSLSVTYGVTADNPAFEELTRALHLVATAVVTPGSVDTARLQDALNVTKQAISDITNVQSQLGVVQGVLDTAKTAHTQLVTLAQQQIGDIENVDVAQ